MINTVLQTIEENNMFQQGDKVIVAVSGGPDSMCLLHILDNMKQQLGITIIAAHINHCLRGKEADLDQQYVEKFCEFLNVECYSEKIDILKVSKEKGISCEMAGREVRYEYFNKISSEIGANKIALAHNANDQAETILMRIMRGTGLEGLVGIKPVRDDIYVRPIINIKRKDIEKYCDEYNLNPRIDKSNLENIYSRNKVRLELIPYIEENFNKDIILTMNRLADTVKKDNYYLESIANEKYEMYCSINESKVIIDKKAFKEHEAILSRIIRKALVDLTGKFYNFEKSHIYDTMDIQKHESGRRIMLPHSVTALNSYGNIHLLQNYNQTIENNEEYRLDINKENIIDDLGCIVKLSIISKEEAFNYKKHKLTKFFDYDKVVESISLRFKREGDKFIPLGMNGSKKLKKLFVDLKVPVEERSNIPLICFGDEIAWVVGYRVSEKFKVNNETKNILQIKFERGEK